MSFCSMQCKMQLIEQHVEGRTRYKTIGVHNPTSHGRLCMKGQHAHQHALHKDRLNHPLIKRNGQFVKATWQEALEEIKTNIESLQLSHGHDVISVYGSASITNEEAYLLGKFARVALKTKYIDYNGRLCMSSAATAANQTFGLGPWPDLSSQRHQACTSVDIGWNEYSGMSANLPALHRRGEKQWRISHRH